MMYGMLLESIQHYLKEIYGDKVWTQICSLAGIENRVFVTHQRYNDELFLKLAEGAACVIGKDSGLEKKDFMKFFGTCFVKFFSNYGYDGIIRVTGRNFVDFLNSIDNIHEHMRFGYPKMQSPSFYCDEESSTGINLHYISKRHGFKYYVTGQIEQIAKEFYSMNLKMNIIGEQQTSRNSHIIYRVEFDNQDARPVSPEKPLSLSCSSTQNTIPLKSFFGVFPFSLVILEDMTVSMAGPCLLSTLGREVVLGKKATEIFTLRRPNTEFTWENLQRKRAIFELISKIPTKSSRYSEQQGQGYPSMESTTKREQFLNVPGQVTPDVIMCFQRYLGDNQSNSSTSTGGLNLISGIHVTQSHEECDLTIGLVDNDCSVTHNTSEKKSQKNITIERKNGLNKLTDAEVVLNNNNNSFKDVMQRCPIFRDSVTPSRTSSDSADSVDYDSDTVVLPMKQSRLHLKGEMKYVTAWKKVLFVCSPVISGFDEMISLGLYMSDLGMYDRSQEMVMTGITPLPQLEYARDQLIERSKKLEENLKKLDEERKRSDELLYRMMPKPIAERLKNGAKAIETCEYFESVTVLFSYWDGFIKFCSSVDAMQVVALVNNMFTIFDCLSEEHDVYKFETLGDGVYMAVSGAPVRKIRHAEPMAAMAMAMIESMKEFKKDCERESLTITVGMHSGAAAAGLVGQKTPQYCLFGDTVNIASRLRTTSMPMRIHISEACRNCLVDTEFKMEFRGHIQLKGLKEEMKTYWLTGRKDEPTSTS